MAEGEQKHSEGTVGEAAKKWTVALDRRAPVMKAGQELLRKIFPDHWSFLLGELALYSFVVLVLTGVYLTMFFSPSEKELVYHGSYRPLDGMWMSEAYASTLHISFDLRAGLLMRQMHHWAALLFLAAISVHLLRIFFTGAFRRPRELNWVIGVTLFILALLEGFCGYSLPDDLLSGTGLRTAEGIVLSVPIVGTYLQMFIWGGQYPSHEMQERLYAAHILLLPGLLIALITAHLILVVYLKHTHWGGPPEHANSNVVGKPAFPVYAAKSMGLFFLVAGVLAALGALVQINPIWSTGPYRTDQVSTDAQPDWYIGFLEGSLRLMPSWETHFLGHTVVWDVFIPAVLLPLILFFVLYVYPFVERWLTGDDKEHHLCDRPRNQPTRTALGAAGVVFYTVLMLAGAQDVLAYVFRSSVNWLNHVLQLALIILPLVTFLLVRRVCRGLQADDAARLARGSGGGRIRRTQAGSYTVTPIRLEADREREILVRDLPQPWTPPRPLAAGRIDRLRAALSAWYVGRPVRLPGAQLAQPSVTLAVADPEEAAQLKGEEDGESQ